MRAQITGLNKAQDNAKDGISLVQTAEGALTEVHDMLNRMYELAEQSANGTYEARYRPCPAAEGSQSQLRDEIDRIADSANFNGIKLLDGSMSTDGHAALTGSVTATKAGVDLDIIMGAYTNASGNDAYLEIAFAHGSSGDKAEISNDGSTLTLTMNSKKDYTAEDITKLLQQATVVTGGTLSDDVKESILSAVKPATVSGEGITAATGAGGKFAASTGAIQKMNPDGKELVLQIGDTSDDFNQLSVGIKDCHAAAIGIGDLDISTQEGAAAALDVIKNAINYVLRCPRYSGRHPEPSGPHHQQPVRHGPRTSRMPSPPSATPTWPTR